jgi:hypothetical protein
MNPHLIPTVIVDKNGKKTTVHRTANRPASNVTIPAPTVTAAKSTPQKNSTPLPVPTPIDPKRLNDIQSGFRGIQALSVRKNINPDEAALIKGILERGHVYRKTLGTISGFMGLFSAGESIKDYDYNTFLLAERYFQKEGSSDGFTYHDAELFSEAVQGLYYRRIEESINVERFTTEEELDTNVAVLRIVMLLSSMGGPTRKKAIAYKEYRTIKGKRLRGNFLRNQAFSDLIRENPDSHYEIEKYIRERGAPKNKQEAIALKTYLDNGNENTTAISDGWL